MNRRSFSLQQQYELASLKRGMQELGVSFMETNNNPQNTTQPENEEQEQELTDFLARIDERLDTHGASIDALIQTLPVDVQAGIRAQINQQQDSQHQQHLANLRRDVDAIHEAQQQQSQKIDDVTGMVQLVQQTLNDYYTRLINGESAIPPKKSNNPGTPPTNAQNSGSNGQSNTTPGNTAPKSPDVNVNTGQQNQNERPYKLVRKRGGRVVKRFLQPEKNKRAV
jgi:hypothetical protein